MASKTEEIQLLIDSGWVHAGDTRDGGWQWRDPRNKGAWYRLEDAVSLEKSRRMARRTH